MRNYYNTDFANMTKEQIAKWIKLHEHRLIGSAIFTKNNSLVSKVVSWVCKNEYPEDKFNPSHVGSLVLIGGNIYIFDMKPPEAKLTKLEEYLLNTKDEYIIVVRNFDLDVENFSIDICKRVNQDYGYISAVQSAFHFMWYPLGEHCSEVHLKELQKQGLFAGENANKTTPEELLHLLLGGVTCTLQTNS